MTRRILLNAKGQVVPLILLVVLVGATLGLSIAGTTIKNIQETNLNEESERAYSAAEAGLEEKLLELEQTGSATEIVDQELASGARIKEVAVSTQASLEIASLAQDNVAQINLECSGCAPGDVVFKWQPGTSLVVTKISGSSEPYTVVRNAYNCNPTHPDSSNGFTNINATVVSGEATLCSVSLSVNGASDRIMRFRAMYGDTSLTVTPSDTNVIPVQSTVLTSTGQSGETERTVQVKRSGPVPPAILDYVLFSSQGSLSK